MKAGCAEKMSVGCWVGREEVGREVERCGGRGGFYQGKGRTGGDIDISHGTYLSLYILTFKLSRSDFFMCCDVMLRSNFICDSIKVFNSIIFILCPHINSNQGLS